MRAGWTMTASVLAMIFNVNRDPSRSPALSPDDFNPMIQLRSAEPFKAPLSVLKTVFVDRKMPEGG